MQPEKEVIKADGVKHVPQSHVTDDPVDAEGCRERGKRSVMNILSNLKHNT